MKHFHLFLLRSSLNKFFENINTQSQGLTAPELSDLRQLTCSLWALIPSCENGSAMLLFMDWVGIPYVVPQAYAVATLQMTWKDLGQCSHHGWGS